MASAGPLLRYCPAFASAIQDRCFYVARFDSMATKSKGTSRRTLLEPHKGDKRYVRRNKQGQFKTEVSVGRSLSADRRRKTKTKAAKGQGDRGD